MITKTIAYRSLKFELYHFSFITNLSHGTSLYTVLRDTCQWLIINFIESFQSTPHKSSSYTWEKNQVADSSIQPSTVTNEIAKSFLNKYKKREKSQSSTPLSRYQKIPKLSSLSLTSQLSTNDNPSNETSSIIDDSESKELQNETLDTTSEKKDEQANEPQGKKSKRGRKKK